MDTTCSYCKKIQYSIMDKNYLKLFKICWSCDKINWENKIISTEEFEKREEEALK